MHLTRRWGANVSSLFFYSRVKGELERDLAVCGFASLTFVRPGLISGSRQEFRAGERATEWLLKTFAPVLPKSWRVNPAGHIAKALLEATIEAKPKTRIISSAVLI